LRSIARPGFARRRGGRRDGLDLAVALGRDNGGDAALLQVGEDGVQSFDPFADRFRYPSTKDGKPFEGIAADLDELFQAHWIIVTWCEGAAIEVRESRSPA
jgi:hypothetical protein